MKTASGKRMPPRLSCLALAVMASLACTFPAMAADPVPAAQRTQASETWVINLESSTYLLNPSDRPALAGLKDHTAYVVTVEIRGVTWYRLRMGFFNSKKEAEATLAKYEDQFPDAWVALVDTDEVRSARSAPPVQAAASPLPPAAAGSDSNGMAELMRQAHDAMLVGDYSRAIRLYTNVLESPVGPYAQDAQEMLGLARERNGQLAHARAEYEVYLRRYPQGDGAARVRQRLLGLITAREDSPERLRAAQNGNVDPSWSGFGSFSQYFRWDQITAADTTTSQSVLISDLDYMLRRRGSDYDVRARFFGQYLYDTDESEDDGRVRAFYVEALSADRGLSGAIGRQSRRDSGLLGRFDGAIVSQPLSARTRLNFSAGVPVDSGEEDRINSHKNFFGVSLDAGNILGAFDTNTYYIQQEVDGILDRQAAGGELRYAQDGRNLFALVDYDVSYATVNTALALAGWTKPDGTSLNLILDYRKTPILTTSNALIAQTAGTISDMLDTMTESEIRQLAEDRTAISRSATVSASKPITERYVLMGDVTASSISGTPESGGVPEMPATDVELFYSVQLVASSLLKRGDTTIFGTRYSDTEFADTISLSLNHRRPVSERFYLNPKLRMDVSDSNTYGDRTTLAASFRVTQQYLKDLAFEGEVGGQWSDQEVNVGSGNTEIYFVYLGFRKIF